MSYDQTDVSIYRENLFSINLQNLENLELYDVIHEEELLQIINVAKLKSLSIIFNQNFRFAQRIIHKGYFLIFCVCFICFFVCTYEFFFILCFCCHKCKLPNKQLNVFLFAWTINKSTQTQTAFFVFCLLCISIAKLRKTENNKDIHTTGKTK